MNKYPPEYWQEMTDEILDNFSFEKVHNCMVALDWSWSDIGGIPEISDLRKCARKLLKDCIDKGHGGTGGFQVRIDRKEGCLSLSFVVEEWDAYGEEEKDDATMPEMP